MIVFTLVPGFLHQHFSYTRAALLGRQNVDVTFDKETAKTQEVLLFDSQTLVKTSGWDKRVEESLAQAGVPAQIPATEKLTEELTEKLTEELPQESLVLKPETPVETTQKTTVTSGNSFFSTKIGQIFLSMTIGLSLVVFLIVMAPAIYYNVFPADTEPVAALEEGTPLGGSFEKGVEATEVEEIALPPQDLSLPTGMWLIIPKIGVRTPLDPTINSEEALLKGVWITPDYGMPGDRTQPVILAAHRYGWQWWWQSDYWQYHSFYRLPDLEPGDIVEVISDQRKYYYEIYAGEEGDLITDYTADMILYTCKFINSPLRHLRYARLIDMDKNTQS